MIGHNNEYACRFAEAMEKLKRLGLKGEVALSAGVVLVSVQGKTNSQLWRKAIKTACTRSRVNWIETRPRKEFYVFTITV